ncbi:MAG: DNA polymerase I [Lachnospiraceae bacterium]|nr:DNA polymerase I [Lachnospiraceae bacterium]
MENKKEKILLIDGHSIVNRAFYGVPPLTNSDGLHTNAIYGFLNIFFNTFSKVKPDYIIVAFDVRAKTFRHEMYDAYKGNRKGMPEELHEQVPVLMEVLNSMNIKTATLEGYEADDVIGTYAKKAEADGLEVVILSGDRDLLQLASDTTLVAIPKTKSGGTEIEYYYAKDVLEKYQVTPKEFIELKALMGDSSDNIPGIPGIGEKTATNLVVQYHSLENAYAHVDEIKPNKAKENLKEYIEQGRMSRTLATINTDSPVEMNYQESHIEGEEVFYNPLSYELYKRLELNKLLERFDVKAGADLVETSFEQKKVSELSEILDIAEAVTKKNRGQIGLYVDPELSLIGLTFADIQNDTRQIKTYVFDGKTDDVLPFLFSENDICVFGLKELLHALSCQDLRSDHIYDLSIMAYLLDPTISQYTYDSVSKDYCGKIIPSRENLIGKKSISDALADPETHDNALKIAAFASETAFRAFQPLKDQLEREEMWDLYLQMEMPLTYSLYYMEKEGIKVNRESLHAFSDQLLEMMTNLEKEIYDEAGEEFNINSPKQLGVILFEKMKLPHGKKTKTGYSTSADVLEKLADEFPFVNTILKYRQVTKLRSTYAEGLVNYISEDGRIHGTFNQTITATGRISSTDPNLQNIPIRNELGQEIRRAFVAKDGYVFLDADYSQIELRLLAHLSGDENLIDSYKSDADIHKITASKVFHTPLDEVTKEQRRNAKAVNFGIVYGISSFGLSQNLSISRKEASEYIKQYFDIYPKVKEYLDNTVKRARIEGRTRTMFGRIRPIPELASSNFMQRSFGERAAMNAPIQGSAADIIKIAMINVEKALMEHNLKAKIVLQIHDELLIEAPEEEVDEVKELLYTKMKEAVILKVPLEVDVNIGKDWFEAH